jgi:hypothetical protein
VKVIENAAKVGLFSLDQLCTTHLPFYLCRSGDTIISRQPATGRRKNVTLHRYAVPSATIAITRGERGR